MTKIQQLENLRFDKPYAPKNGLWYFNITEIYPTLPPISYKFFVPDWTCTFYEKQTGGFGVFFGENPFEPLEKKAETLGCEIEIYPCFAQ